MKRSLLYKKKKGKFGGVKGERKNSWRHVTLHILWLFYISVIIWLAFSIGWEYNLYVSLPNKSIQEPVKHILHSSLPVIFCRCFQHAPLSEEDIKQSPQLTCDNYEIKLSCFKSLRLRSCLFPQYILFSPDWYNLDIHAVFEKCC